MEHSKQRHALVPPDPARMASARGVREKYQREIASLPGVKPLLEKLRTMGIEPERVLKYLAAVVVLERDARWRNDTEEIKTTLRKLGGGLKRMAKKIETTYSSDVNCPDLYALSLGFVFAPLPPHDARKTVERMRETVADLRAKAAAFGQFRKQVIPDVRRKPEVALLRYVSRRQPWDAPKCPLQLRLVLAELLHAVCEKYGIQKSFTAESLFKTFRRHVLREGSLSDKTHPER